jgi:hypothetical protein
MMMMTALRREQSVILVVIIVTISLMIMIINTGKGNASAAGVVDAFHYSTTTISSTSRKLSRTIIASQTKITTGTTSLLISSEQANSMRGKMIGVRRPLLFSLFAAANGKSSSSSASSYSSMFNLLEQYKEREGDCDVPRNHKEDGKNLGEWLNTRRMDKKKRRLDAEKEKEMEEIGVVWDIYSKQWEDSFTLLVQYKKKVGNCNVPRDHKEDEKNLGSWLNTQRLDKKKGRLDARRESGLDEIGIVWDVLSQKWETMFTLLLQYKEREGDCNASQKHKEDGENLGQWLNTQRANKKSGIMDAENQQRLDEIDIVWYVLSQKWETMFALLSQYKEREGNCNVPAQHKEDGENLGPWLNQQRTENTRRKMDGGRGRRLEEMGVSWDLFSQKWDTNFNLLVQYKEREGDCNVPQRHKEDGENLGIWLTTRRMDKKKGILDPEKQILLEEIGVVWSIRKQKI